MTDTQLYIAVGVPMLFNGLLIWFLRGWLNAEIVALTVTMNQRFEGVNQRFEGVNQRFDAIDRRFDDMRDLWRAELRRVEEVLDARLKHQEEKR